MISDTKVESDSNRVESDSKYMTNCVTVTSSGVLIHQLHLIWEESGSD